MSLLKYLERARRMDDLIRRHATGNVCEFCQRIGISRSMMMEHLRDLKQLGAPIRYCEVRRSYYYDGEFSLFLGNRDLLRDILGGRRPPEGMNWSNSPEPTRARSR